MTNIEQLRKWEARIRERIVQEEEKEGTVHEYPCDHYYDIIGHQPLVLCPTCGEPTEPGESRLAAEGDRWEHASATCIECGTDFRLGQVPDRCALCCEPFATQPHCDRGDYHHHWCAEDRHNYCTPCYMQLFFDGYIDLSSDNPEPIHDKDSNELLYLRCWRTYVGSSVAPYRSRLIAKGYQEAAVLEDYKDVSKTCRQAVRQGRRYLILCSSIQGTGKESYHVFHSGGSSGPPKGVIWCPCDGLVLWDHKQALPT